MIASSATSLNAAPASLLIGQNQIDPKIWLVIVMLLVLVGVGALLIFAIRRKLLSDEFDGPQAGGGILEHLDQMKRDGTISQEEYDQTRQTIIKKDAARLKEERDQNQSS